MQRFGERHFTLDPDQLRHFVAMLRLITRLGFVVLAILAVQLSTSSKISFYNFLKYRGKMLKFVRTKNFKMPGNRQLVDIKLCKDESGNLVQKERWEDSVVVCPSDQTEAKVVKVPFTKTYTTLVDKQTGKTSVLESIATENSRGDERETIVKTDKAALKTSGKLPCTIGLGNTDLF